MNKAYNKVSENIAKYQFSSCKNLFLIKQPHFSRYFLLKIYLYFSILSNFMAQFMESVVMSA